MIGRLSGVLAWKRAPHTLVDVSGVGYEVEVPLTTFFKLPPAGEKVMLHTHLAVREDAHVLYGFGSESERALFRELIKVSGVGGRLALTILSGISADEFVRCVRDNDVAGLTRLPGVGKKTAARLVMEMRDRLGAKGEEGSKDIALPHPTAALAADPVKDAVSALITLGYKPPEASRMIQQVLSPGADCEELIRKALKQQV